MKDQSSFRQKVLMCYHSAEYGGVEKQILDIIVGLADDFDIIVVCPNGPLVKDYLKNGAVKHINLKPKYEADLSYSLKIKEIVKTNRIDIVHSHELLTGSLATFGAWLARCPKRIYHVHTPFSQWQYSGAKRIPALVVNTIVNAIVGNIFATDVLALTPSIKNVRVKKEFILPSKIRVIPNGVDLSLLKKDEKGRIELRNGWDVKDSELVIGNVSRFTEEKGHSILLQSLAKLQELPIKAVLAGSGILFEKMQKMAQDLGISDKVIFAGRFKDEEKSRVLSAFDVFVFPTLAEGFGIVMIEAMAMGLPVIASDLPVLHDVGGEAVHFFTVGDYKELSEAIQYLQENPKYRDELSQRAMSQAQKYSIETFWKNYRELYQHPVLKF